MSGEKYTRVVWSQDYVTGRRHCWFNTIEQRFETEKDHTTCEMAGKPEHRDVRGKPGWMRFIHAFADQVDENPFVGEGDEKHFLFIEVERLGHSFEGRLVFCETYLKRRDPESWGLDPIFRVYLDRDVTGQARIECYDPDLLDACIAAATAVEQSYIDEEEALVAA